MSGKLLSLREVADRLGVHPNTVKKLPIAWTRVGQQRRYHPDVVARYLKDHSNRPAAWAESVGAA